MFATKFVGKHYPVDPAANAIVSLRRAATGAPCQTNFPAANGATPPCNESGHDNASVHFHLPPATAIPALRGIQNILRFATTAGITTIDPFHFAPSGQKYFSYVPYYKANNNRL